jgi:hypothetical protein
VLLFPPRADRVLLAPAAEAQAGARTRSAGHGHRDQEQLPRASAGERKVKQKVSEASAEPWLVSQATSTGETGEI